MKNIKAIAFIDKKDKNIPSIGLLEKDTFSLSLIILIRRMVIIKASIIRNNIKKQI